MEQVGALSAVVQPIEHVELTAEAVSERESFLTEHSANLISDFTYLVRFFLSASYRQNTF